MIELIFSVCLVHQPDQCHNERMSFFQTRVTPGQCVMMGQIEIARWMDGHPNYVLKKWSCRPAGRRA